MIKNFPEDIYKTAPTGKWSIAQILTHLLTSERLSVVYMKKKALGIESLSDSGIMQYVLSTLLKISQRIPFRYKAPKAIIDNTPETLTLSELISSWEKSRENLKTFLETIDDKHIKRVIFKHPVGGRLDARQAMEFMYEHINHHLPQIKSLLKC